MESNIVPVIISKYIKIDKEWIDDLGYMKVDCFEILIKNHEVENFFCYFKNIRPFNV